MLLVLSLPILNGCTDAVCRGLALGLVPRLRRGLQGARIFWARLHAAPLACQGQEGAQTQTKQQRPLAAAN